VDPDFKNVYDDDTRSRAYATLEFPGTYYLAFRDLPAIIRAHVRGTRALDFGCGAGRSTRFLRGLGFETTGIDISEPMLSRARESDPGGDYRLVREGDFGGLPARTFDLVLAAFTFDNVPTLDTKVALFDGLKGLLAEGGRLVAVVSSPDIYVHEWASFSTRDFPENRAARCGDRVRIIMLDVDDRRPVEDVLWTDEGYLDVYRRAGLRSIAMHRPLGTAAEPYRWVSETTIAPWVVHVIGVADDSGPTAGGTSPLSQR
jgi:SAM-dependent methyltransferase